VGAGRQSPHGSDRRRLQILTAPLLHGADRHARSGHPRPDLSRVRATPGAAGYSSYGEVAVGRWSEISR
jgi:hypothetical protein